ncbi:MAG: hypothetical protein HKN79_04395 [Flavobacteriales bacterium]|nr:hypothetical protein [Flavobacteriales bacterium]
MIHTIAYLVTGAMMAATPIATETGTDTDLKSKTVTSVTIDDSYTTVSYPVSAATSFEELEELKGHAEEAGVGFTYKKRGVKTRLVIDMVIEYGDDYELERLVVKEEDGTKHVKWTVNEDGQAVTFKERPEVKEEF